MGSVVESHGGEPSVRRQSTGAAVTNTAARVTVRGRAVAVVVRSILESAATVVAVRCPAVGILATFWNAATEAFAIVKLRRLEAQRSRRTIVLHERIWHSEVARQRAVARAVVGAVLGHAQRVTRNPAPVRTALTFGGAWPAVVLPGWRTRHVARLTTPRPRVPKLAFAAGPAFTHLRRRTTAPRLCASATATQVAPTNSALTADRCSAHRTRGATAAASRSGGRARRATSSRASAPRRASSRITR